MSMTLDELRADVERKYADYVVNLSDGTPVHLRSGLRLSKPERAKLRDLQKRYTEVAEADEYDEDALTAVVADQIGVIADSPDNARRLVTEIGDDLALLMAVMENYIEATQPGEA